MSTIPIERQIHFPSIFDLPGRNELSFLPDLERFYRQARNQGLVRDVIVHGSYGDFTYTHYSDLEITVVWNDESLIRDYQKAKLQAQFRKNLNRLIIAVDPLQHHGAFFLTRRKIENYTEQELPLCAYNKSWSLSGLTVNFQVVETLADSTFSSRRKLNATLQHLACLEKRYLKYGYGMFAIKRIISNFLMIPVFYYQARGLELSKSEAIAKAVRDYPNVFYDPIESASSLRRSWPKTPNWVAGLRRRIVRERIPEGPLDLFIVNLYKVKSMQQRFEVEFRSSLRRFMGVSSTIFHEDR